MSSSSVAATAADAVGRGAAGRFPAAAAVEVEDPLVGAPFFTMVAAAEFSFLFVNGGGRSFLFLSVSKGRGRRRQLLQVNSVRGKDP